MKKSSSFWLFLALFVYVPIFAQDDPYDLMGTLDKTVNIPQSPEVGAFEKYGETSANLYSGTPNISIPIYTLQGSEISLPISLTYDASGIKVDQIATNVGLGWNLNFGGVVSRKVNHMPDQLSSGTNYHRTVYSTYVKDWQDYFYTSSPTQALVGVHDDGKVSSLRQFYKYYQKGAETNEEVDTQADIFSFNVNGLSGTIIIDYQNTETGTSNPLAYCFENPDLKVSVNATLGDQPISSEIYSWTITNVDGTQYFFDKAEYTWTDYASELDYIREYKSAWYLSKVTSPNGLDVFEFDYSNPQLWTDAVNRADKRTVYRTSFDPGTGQPIEGAQSPDHNRYKSKSIHLTGIRYTHATASNAVQILDVTTASRNDLPGLQRYTQLHFKDTNGDTVQKVDFSNNDYFRSTPSQQPIDDDLTNSRLKLDEVLIYRDDLNTPKKYSFTYIDPDLVPSRQCNAMDYWGYYNGGNCNDDLTADAKILDPNWPVTRGMDRSPDFNYADIGSLESITYPTGGKTEFEYEPHRGLTINTQDAVNNIVGGLRIKRTVSYESGTTESLSKYYFYNDLEAKIGDGTYTIGTNVDTNMLNNTYDTSGNAQQVLTFHEKKELYTPPGVNSSGGNTFEYYQYATNLAPAVPNHVTYSKVSELVFKGTEFQGATIYEYHDGYYWSGGAYPTEPVVNREVLNGEVLTSKVFGVENNALKLMQETINEYTVEEFDHPDADDYNGMFIYHDRAAGPAKARGCLEINDITGDPYNDILIFEDQQEMGFGNPPQYAWNCPSGTTSNAYASYIEYKVNRYIFKQQWKRLDKTTTKTYEQSGSLMTNVVEYLHDSVPNYNLTTRIKSTDSKGLTSETKVKYPFSAIGAGLYTSAEETVLTDMLNRNMIAGPVYVQQWYNDTLMSTQKVINDVAFANGTIDVIRPATVEVAKASDALETRRTYHSYDDYGNLTEVSQSDGSRTYYIWGYHGQQLLAEIKNKSSASIPPGIQLMIDNLISSSDAENSAIEEDQLRIDLDALRSQAYFGNALVTTFTYDPGIGVTSVTDPRGYTMFYEYDQHNRLVAVRDADNNLVGQNEYSYRINN